MKILLTGSNGQLGRAIIDHFQKFINNEEFNLIKMSRNEFDLLDLEKCSLIIKQIKPDFIINAAAYTAVDNAEKEFEIAKIINTEAPKMISNVLRETGGILLHLSTDYVFDGVKSLPYETNHLRNPINNYGKSKAEGEKYIEQILFKSNQGFILRTSWLIGPVGNNFALTMLRLLDERDKVKVICDQIGSPTSTFSLAKACWQIILKIKNQEKLPNILHWSDAGVASWYDITMCIAEIGKKIGLLKETAYIYPISTKQFKTFAKRPNFSILNCFETKKALGIKQIYWRDSLREVLELRKHYLEKNIIS